MRMAGVYNPVGPDDGTRILVDRLWPRGIRKDDPRVGSWCKDVAPSTRLVTSTRQLDLSHLAVLRREVGES